VFEMTHVDKLGAEQARRSVAFDVVEAKALSPIEVEHGWSHDLCGRGTDSRLCGSTRTAISTSVASVLARELEERRSSN